MYSLENVISLNQATQISGYTQDYLGYLIRNGDIKGVKKGGVWFTTEGEVQDYILKQKTHPQEPAQHNNKRNFLQNILIFTFLLFMGFSSFAFAFNKISNLPQESFFNATKQIATSLQSTSSDLTYGWSSFTFGILNNVTDSVNGTKNFVNSTKNFVINVSLPKIQNHPLALQALPLNKVEKNTTPIFSVASSVPPARLLTASVGNSLQSTSGNLADGWSAFTNGLLNNITNFVNGTKLIGNSIADGLTSTKNFIAGLFNKKENSLAVVPVTKIPSAQTPPVPLSGEAKPTPITPTPVTTTIIQQISQAGLTGHTGKTGIQGPQGPKGDKGDTPDMSNFVTLTAYDRQVSGLLSSIEKNVKSLSDSLSAEVSTDLLTVGGSTTLKGLLSVAGQAVLTNAPTLAHSFSPWPDGTSNVSDATLYINPATAVADSNLIGAAVSGAVKFLVDAEGDVYARNLILTGTTSTGTTDVAGDLTVQDNTTLGDASSDILTVNATSSFNAPVSITGSNSFTVGTGLSSLGGGLNVAGNFNLNTNGTNALFSTYKGANSDGYNIWIGGGGQSSLGSIGAWQGSYNTAIGMSALNVNTTGDANTANGMYSLRVNTTGSNNTANGANALYNNTTGSQNTVIGYNTGLGITTGSNNTILGAQVTGLAAALSNNIILANGAGTIKAQNDGTNWNLTGKVGVGISPTALLHIKAGTATANTAPLKFTSGALLTTPEAGAVEYDNSGYYGTGATLAVGDSYGGGIVAYILKAGDPGYDATQTKGLIAAVSAQSVNTAWIIGGNTQTTLNGNTSTAFGTGAANTAAMAAQTGYTGGAAKLCLDYRGGGYADWYLPSEGEVEAIDPNQAYIPGWGVAYMWSSSEVNATSAWGMNVNVHSATSRGKDANYEVTHAVRSFSIPLRQKFAFTTDMTNTYIPYTGGTRSVDLGIHNLTVDTNSLFVDSVNHRVGVGTLTPTQALSFDGTTSHTLWMERNTTAATAGQGLTVSSGGATLATTDKLGGDLILKSGISTGTGSSALRFFTATPQGSTNTTDNTPTEKMTILGNGNVGIGITTPTSILHTVASGAKTLAYTGNYLSNTATSSTASIAKIGLDVQSIGTWNGTTATNTGLNVNVSGGTTNYAATFMGGNVGIGTATPGAPLSIRQDIGLGGVSDNAILIINNNGTANRYSDITFGYISTNAQAGIRGVNINPGINNFSQLQFFTSGPALGKNIGMTLDYNSNVGIGITTPTSLLHTVSSAAKTTAYTGILHSVTDTSSTASINKIGMDIESTGTWNGTSAINTGLVVNATGGTTNYAATFMGGNVGIGVTNPTQKLDVAGNINISSGSAYMYNGANVIRAQTGFGNYFFGNSGNLSMTGQYNTSIGNSALAVNTTGGNNTAIGFNALSNITSGGFNTAIGTNAGNFIADGVTVNQTSSSSVYEGYKAMAGANGNSNEIVIGASAIGNGSNTAIIGNSSLVRTYLTGVNLKLGTTAAGTAPLKFTSGALLTTPEAGAVEYDNSGYYGTVSLNIGDSYGGGKIAYILQASDPGYDATQVKGIIAATADQGGIRWYNGTFTTTGATATALGTGMTNTNTIIASQGVVTTSYAAGFARAYTGGGYTDWYLPSKDELNKLYLNKAAIGGFGASYYWSSSESSSTYAFCQLFSNGDLGLNKNTAYSVRAVRSFAISSTRQKFAFSSDVSNLYLPYSGANSNVNLGIHNLTVDTNSLFVDSVNHRVGLGTLTPTNALSFDGTTSHTIWMERNTTAATGGLGLTLSSGGATLATTDKLGGDLILKSGISTGTGDSALRFFTATPSTTGTTDNTPTEKMTILGNGNVGIGTTNPGAPLTIQTTGSGYVRAMKIGTANADGDGQYIQFSSSSSSDAYGPTIGGIRETPGTGGLGALVFSTGSISPGEKMRITSGGSVGIGTTAPGAKLEIWQGSGSGSRDQLILSQEGVYGKYTFSQYTAPAYANQYLSLGTSGNAGIFNNVMTWSALNGNVGIGTTGPSEKLHISSLTGVKAATRFTSGGESAEISLTDADNNFRMTNFSTYSANDALYSGLRFYTNNDTTTPKVTIQRLGNVGIGTTNPTSPLSVSYDSGSVPSLLIGTGASSNNFVSVSGGRAMFGLDTAGANANGTNGNLAFSAGSSKGIEFFVGGTSGTFLSGTNAMFISQTGNVGIGQITPVHKLDILQTGTTTGLSGLNILNSGVNVGTAYGDHVSVTGASVTNVAGYFSATGATNNYGLIVANGNVGIGTTAPAARLDISTTGGTNGLIVQNGTGAYGVFGHLTTDANSPFVIKTNANEDLYFNIGQALTYTSPPMMIQASSGNVGIGTTNPSDKLHISGASVGAGDGNTAIYLEQLAGSVGARARLVSGVTGGTNPYFAIETRQTNNPFGIIERLRIEGTSGNVGIGTTAPGDKLQVLGTKDSSTSPYTPGIAVTDTTSMAQGVGGGINFGGSYTGTTPTTGAVIHAYKSNGTAGDFGFDLAFNTRVNGGSNTEKMRITTGGNVGIGTTSPTGLLHTVKANNYNESLFDTYSATSLTDSEIAFRKSHQNTVGNTATVDGESLGVFGWWGNTGSAFQQGAFMQVMQDGAAGTYIPTKFRFRTSDGVTGAVDRLVIDKNGNVGIGTTAPTVPLEVNGATKLGKLTIGLASQSNPLFVYGNSADAVIMAQQDSTGMIMQLNGNGGANRVSVLQNGNVGIGTTAPGTKLEVSGDVVSTGSGNGLYVYNVGTPSATNKEYLRIFPSGNIYSMQSTYGGTGTARDIDLNIAGNSALRVQASTRNVGIGTTNPTEKLHINGNIMLSAGDRYIYYDTNGKILAGAEGAAVYFGYGFGSRPIYIGSLSSGNILFKTTGNTIIDGNVGIGTTNPGGKLHVAGGNLILGPTDATTAASLQFREGSTYGTNFIGFKVPDSTDITTSITFTLPTTAGTVGQVLQTSGATGILSWTANAASGMANPMLAVGDLIYGSVAGTPATPAALTIGTAGQCLIVNGSGLPVWGTCTGAAAVPAGADTEVQFHDGTIFGTSSSFTYNKTNFTLSSLGLVNGNKISLALRNTSTGDTATNSLHIGNDAAVDTLDLWVNSSANSTGANTASIFNRTTVASTGGIGVLTFGTNNTEKMRIDASGNVGIGTTVVGSALLDIGTGTPTTAANGLMFGTDASANLYRSTTGTIKTDGAFVAVGSITGAGGAFTTLTSSGATTLGTGASSINTIGSTTTPGTLTLHGATTLDNTFTVSGANLTTLGGNLTVTGTAWTATPTISGLITATSGITSTGALIANSTATFNNTISQVGTGTFSTGTGAVSINGATTLISTFAQTGANTFSTGTGAISLNGDTTIITGKAFTITNGTTNITGATTILGTTLINSTGTSATTIGNSTGVLTLASGGVSSWTNTAGNLTIQTATSGTMAIDSAGILNLGTVNSTATNLGKSATTLTINPTAWTATPTISGLITATSGITSTGALIANSTATFNNNISQVGTGTFSTGTGAVSLNGDTTIASGKGLTLTSGNITLSSGKINNLAITSPATGSTLTIIDNKTFTVNKTMSLTSADDTGVYTLPTGIKTLVATDISTLSSLATVGTITSGGLGAGAVIGGATMTLGSDASYDMYYRGATGALTRLANGTTGQALIATTGSAPSWSSTPTFSGMTLSANPVTDPSDVYLCISTGGVVHQGTTCTASAQRFKDDITPLAHGLDWLNQFTPSTYIWKYNGSSGMSLIADNVAGIDPQLAIYQDGEVYSLNDRAIQAVMVKAIQELDLNVEDLSTKIDGGPTITGMMTDFFGGVVTSVSDGVANMKDLVVGTLKIGSPAKRTGITLYDEVTGDPYCISVANGETKTTQGECGVIDTEKIAQEKAAAAAQAAAAAAQAQAAAVALQAASDAAAQVDPTCSATQTLVNHICTDPAPVDPTCTAPQTLVNHVCTDPIVVDPTCSDGIQNQDETGVDTGGVCTPSSQ